MDEEYSESVDTSADTDVSDTGAAEDISDDIPDDVPEDIPEDDFSDTDDFSEDMSDETVNDSGYEEADDIEEDAAVSEDDELDESIDDLDEDTYEEPDVSSESGDHFDDIPEDPGEIEEDLEDENDAIEDIPEDTENDEEIEPEGSFEEDVPEDVTDAETADETVDAEDAGTAEQPDSQSDLETYDYETSPETLDAVDPETSGEFVSSDNPYQERWERFGEEFSDGSDETEGWDSLKDVPFSGDEQTDTGADADDSEAADAIPPSEQPDADKAGDTAEINSVSDYMNAHNYGPDDFAAYSQDPQWRQLMRQEYPDYELPEMAQESASAQLSQYMNDHNYGIDDYAEYSQDPTWRELHSAAFPDDELPALKDDKNEQQRPAVAPAGGENSPPPPNNETTEGDPPPPDSGDASGEFELLKKGNEAINQRLSAKAKDDGSDLSQDIAEANDQASEYNKTLKDFCEANGYAKNADFSDFDPHVAYDLAKSVVDAKQDFPDLEVNYLGSIDHQVKGLHDTVEASQFDFYKKNGFDEELAQQMAKQYADDFISNSKLDDTEGTYAWSLRTGNPALDKYDGVAVNNDYAKDYARFKSEKQADEIAKWAPIGCGSPKAVADHELGHEIDNLLGASNDGIINDLYSNMMKENKAEEMLSGYSRKNVKEFIAESYSEYRNNSDPREISRAVYNRLIELRDQKTSARGL